MSNRKTSLQKIASIIALSVTTALICPACGTRGEEAARGQDPSQDREALGEADEAVGRIGVGGSEVWRFNCCQRSEEPSPHYWKVGEVWAGDWPRANSACQQYAHYEAFPVVAHLGWGCPVLH